MNLLHLDGEKKEEETSIHLDVFARALKIIDTDESAQSLSLRAVERNVFVFFLWNYLLDLLIYCEKKVMITH